MDLSKLSPAEVREEAERRRRLQAAGLPFTSPAAAVAQRAAVGTAPDAPARATDRISIGTPPIASRAGTSLSLAIPHAPRTKKNGTQLGIKQTTAYRRFRLQVRDFIDPFREQLGLPMPPAWYNCTALFYVDNEACDTCGLIQGLADALQDAGVVTDDQQLRRWDGTDWIVDKLRPRVLVHLQLIAPFATPAP